MLSGIVLLAILFVLYLWFDKHNKSNYFYLPQRKLKLVCKSNQTIMITPIHSSRIFSSRQLYGSERRNLSDFILNKLEDILTNEIAQLELHEIMLAKNDLIKKCQNSVRAYSIPHLKLIIKFNEHSVGNNL